MTGDSVREPSLQELIQLTLRGIVAYATRCARRMQPSFELPEDDPEREPRMRLVASAIEAAEDYVQGRPPELARASALSERTYELAELTCSYTSFAAYPAAHAVRGVSVALKFNDRADPNNHMDITASGYGASRVVLGNHPATERVVAALRGDFEKLHGLELGEAGSVGQAFDPSEQGPLGPLWPPGAGA